MIPTGLLAKGIKKLGKMSICFKVSKMLKRMARKQPSTLYSSLLLIIKAIITAFLEREQHIALLVALISMIYLDQTLMVKIVQKYLLSSSTKFNNLL